MIENWNSIGKSLSLWKKINSNNDTVEIAISLFNTFVLIILMGSTIFVMRIVKNNNEIVDNVLPNQRCYTFRQPDKLDKLNKTEKIDDNIEGLYVN